MQRSAVLFPDPLRPIRVTTSPSSTRSVRSWRTSKEPYAFLTFSKRTIGSMNFSPTHSDSSRAFQASLELAAQKRHWVADYEVNTGSYREHKERSERGVIDDLRRVGKIGEPDDHRVGGVFYDLHKKAYRRGDRDTYGLRENDINEALHRRESEALAGLPLSARDCLNAALPDFTKIGA